VSLKDAIIATERLEEKSCLATRDRRKDLGFNLSSKGYNANRRTSLIGKPANQEL